MSHQPKSRVGPSIVLWTDICRTMTGEEPSDRDSTDSPAHIDQSVETETTTFESHGLDCEADLYLPADLEPPLPAIVMANIFGAERSWGLVRFAERFAADGLAAFVFDYRHFGGSEGEPRRLIDPHRQVADWQAALAYVRSLEQVDEERVVLWGTSFSGGHVLSMATRDPDAVAVISQVPFVDGRATVAHQSAGRGPFQQVRDFGLAVADRIGGAVGLGPLTMPIVTEPGGGGLVDSPGALSGFLAMVPDGAEVVNRAPARVVLDLPTYRPGLGVGDIDVPVHIVVAEEDRLLPRGPTEKTVERLADPSVHRLSVGHLDVHVDPWVEEVLEEQREFLDAVLEC